MENAFDYDHFRIVHSPFFLTGTLTDKCIGYDILSKVIYFDYEDFRVEFDGTFGPQITMMHCVKILGYKIYEIKYTLIPTGPTTFAARLKVLGSDLTMTISMIRKSLTNVDVDMVMFGKKTLLDFVLSALMIPFYSLGVRLFN